MENVFLICFFVGLFFTIGSAFLAGVFGGHDGGAHGDAHVGDAHVGDAHVGDAHVGDLDAGDLDAGDAVIGEFDVGDIDVGGADAPAHLDMGHDFDHSVAEAGGDGHVVVGTADAFPGLSPWSPMVLCSFLTTFGGLGYVSMAVASQGAPISVLAGLVGGVLLAALVFVGMNKLFSALQSTSEVHVADLVGMEAEVITPIPEGGVGEIAYVAKGTRLSAPARSVNGKPIGRAMKVKIVRIAGTMYTVKPA